jgi:hypothetical protein
MPFPTRGESTEHYMHRWMSSDEARASFPNRKQQIAVGLSEARQHHLAGAVRRGKRRPPPHAAHEDHDEDDE